MSNQIKIDNHINTEFYRYNHSHSRSHICRPVPAFLATGNTVIIIRRGDAEDTLYTAQPAIIYQWQGQQDNQFIAHVGHSIPSTYFVYQLYHTVVFGDDVPPITLQCTTIWLWWWCCKWTNSRLWKCLTDVYAFIWCRVSGFSITHETVVFRNTRLFYHYSPTATLCCNYKNYIQIASRENNMVSTNFEILSKITDILLINNCKTTIRNGNSHHS